MEGHNKENTFRDMNVTTTTHNGTMMHREPSGAKIISIGYVGGGDMRTSFEEKLFA